MLLTLFIIDSKVYFIFLDLTVRKNPKFEEIVWVKFEDKMSRAKILEKSEKMYTVFLLDIGKSLCVSADNIFEMSNDLKQVSF